MPALADILLERFDYQADCLPISRPINLSTARDPYCRFLFSRNGSRVPTGTRSVPVLFACTAYERCNGLFDGRTTFRHDRATRF